MPLISSAHNETFKYWRSLTKAKGLKLNKQFLLSGIKLVEELILTGLDQIALDTIIVSPAHSEWVKNHWAQKPTSLSITELTQPLYDELDTLGTGSPILVLNQPILHPWQMEDPIEGLEVLCPFGDPQNLGALIRTAYAFGAQKVVLLEESANPFLPKSIKASAGAILRAPLYQGPSIQKITAPAVALDLSGMPIQKRTWPKNLRLLLGEEGLGIPPHFKGERMTLVMKNPIESINAALAGGIAIYHLLEGQNS